MKYQRKNKHNKYRIGDRIYNLFIYAYEKEPEVGLWYDTIFCDLDYKGLDLTLLVSDGGDRYRNEKTLEAFFKPIKKEFEKLNPNTLIIFNYPTSFNSANSHGGKNAHMMIQIAHYNKERLVGKKELDKWSKENIALMDKAVKMVEEKIALIDKSLLVT